MNHNTICMVQNKKDPRLFNLILNKINSIIIRKVHAMLNKLSFIIKKFKSFKMNRYMMSNILKRHMVKINHYSESLFCLIYFLKLLNLIYDLFIIHIFIYFIIFLICKIIII